MSRPGPTDVTLGSADSTTATVPAAVPEERPETPRAWLDPYERYEDLGLIGEGGMGVVHRVYDRWLDRTSAMKISKDLTSRPGPIARFSAEVHLTAALEHPGIIPVHDRGRLTDGRPFFTMKEVRGRVFREIIREAHGSGTTWSLRQLVDVLRDVCSAVGFAHAAGVLHRDLKPANVMVGDFGEVYVVDWGLARRFGRPEEAQPGLVGRTPPPLEPARTAPLDATLTRVGQVVGSPAYMPPEQARGELTRLGPRTDVYALGAILYEILSGHPPYSGRTEPNPVLLGPPAPLPESAPAELRELCTRAMAFTPEDRFADATEVGRALSAWLDGARRGERAHALVAEAGARAAEAGALRERAAAARENAAALLAGTRPWEQVPAKEEAWNLQDQAKEIERDAEARDLEGEQILHAALTYVAELPEAHAALAARYRAVHARAEGGGERAPREEALLRAHAMALPEGHPDRAEHLRWLEGTGALTLVTDVPAEARLFRYQSRNRRLVPVFERTLGTTPLTEVSLPMGSWLVELHAPGRAVVRYPVHIRRCAHWDGRRPGADTPTPIHLPPEGSLDPDDCYIPAGWFRAGGSAEILNALPPRDVWIDGLVIRRHPVTVREYIVFLDDLVARGEEARAWELVPRERPTTTGEGRAWFELGPDRRFFVTPDYEGDLPGQDYPVFNVDLARARAYARWLAARTGLPWRLPRELEWEKAARGVDGRTFPWGEFADPSWCRNQDSHPVRVITGSVHDFPLDESPYGVRGVGGNVGDWTEDVNRPGVWPGDETKAPETYDANALFSIVRGGCWRQTIRASRTPVRGIFAPMGTGDWLGFRVIRSV